MSYQVFDLSSDVANVQSSVNEVVSVSASLYASNLNVKFFQNIASGSSTDLGGYWETAYDGAPTGVTSTALLDFTYGYSSGSVMNALATVSSSQNEKVKMYRQMASILLGSPDSLFEANGSSHTEAFFIMVKRSIQKDELKKGATALTFHNIITYYTASDNGASTNFKQKLGGDYAELSVLSGSTTVKAGTIWYNAGIIVINPRAFEYNSAPAWSGSKNLDELERSGSINNLVDGLRTHVDRIDFHNQTNLMSTVYFCRAANSSFNYSSNPTFLDDNKRIRTTSGSNVLQTRTYVTKVGLYDSNETLLAVASVNKPIAKSPDSESIFRVRLDF